MTSQYDILTFFILEMIKTRIQGSVQSLVRKCAESANLPQMTDFKGTWPRRVWCQEHCFNISKDIPYSVFTTFQLQYYDITDLICIIEKRQYLKNEKRYFKKKTPFFCILKGLSNKQKKYV